MELHEVRYFLALGQTLNFTRAAEVCNVTQPALTRAIQKIEGELGGLLVSRERNNTHLTELGRMLQPQFEAMIEGAETARQMATRFLRLEGAQMTVGVMRTIGPMRFVSFLSRFRAAYPGIELTLIEAVPKRLSELLVAAEIDVAIMAQPGSFPEPLSAQPIYLERFVIACALAHRFAQRNNVEMADLDGEIYLQRINCEYREYLAKQLEERGAAIARSYRSEQEDWIQTMVAAGMGICFLPEFSACVPGLVVRPVIEPDVRREVCLVTIAGRRWSAPVTAFVSAVHAYPWSHEPPIASAVPPSAPASG